MTRDTDSSSSGPQGRGGAAYPSGTPPYGSRPFPSLHPQERPRPAGTPESGANDAEPEQQQPPAAEPKTETTLTTRVRINIPGSRPIPPVVVRTPVEEGRAAAAPAEPAPREPEAEAEGEADAEGEKRTSDWFAPRKPVSPLAQPGGEDTGTGFTLPGGPGEAGGEDGNGPAPADFFVPAQPRGDDGRRPSPDEPFADPFAASFAETFGEPDTGAHQVPGAFQPPPGRPAAGTHDTPVGGFPSPFAPAGDGDFPAEPAPFGTEDFPPGVPRPTGGPFDPGPGRGPGGRDDDPFAEYRPPTGPTSGPVTGDMPVPPVGEGRPHPPVAETPLPGRPGARDGGDTLVGGIPPVPAEGGPMSGPGPMGQGPLSGPGARGHGPLGQSAMGSGPMGGGPLGNGPMGNGPMAGPMSPRGPVPDPEPAPAPAPAPAPRPAPAPAAARKKGRSKLALLGVLVGGVVVVAYGAGLLMNHNDVPKGTVVLGIDIGNMTQDQAVQALDKKLGTSRTAPLELTVGGRKQSLKPSIAGLSVDTDATVQKVAHTDYNPVSVIGSLFGQTRQADPVVLVDQDKLKSALTTMVGKSSTGSEGMVRFENGKAVAVPGKAGQSFDVDEAASEVAAAYRTRAETGTDQPVALKPSTVPPKVTQAELDKAVNGFGRTAMMGPVTVRADAVHSIPFNKTLSQFLTMRATPDGKLAPHIDLSVLQGLVGTTFQGILLERADGSKTPVTTQDVATALMQGLNATDPAKRVVTLPNIAG